MVHPHLFLLQFSLELRARESFRPRQPGRRSHPQRVDVNETEYSVHAREHYSDQPLVQLSTMCQVQLWHRKLYAWDWRTEVCYHAASIFRFGRSVSPTLAVWESQLLNQASDYPFYARLPSPIIGEAGGICETLQREIRQRAITQLQRTEKAQI